MKKLEAKSQVRILDDKGEVVKDYGWKKHDVIRTGVNDIVKVDAPCGDKL